MFLFAFTFSLPLIFTLLAASISHFPHPRYEIFIFSSNEIHFLYFCNHCSSPLSNILVSVDIKNNMQKWTAYRIYKRPTAPKISNQLTFKLQRTANEYATKRRIYKRPDQQKNAE